MNRQIQVDVVRCVSVALVVTVVLALGLGATVCRADEPKLLAVYFGIFDDGYVQSMAVQDQIPWDKVNRVQIVFATVEGGILQDITVEDSTAEAQDRIRNIISLVRDANPAAEIFIVSNYGETVTNEYVNAAQDPQRFADSVLAYLQDYGLDGFDMDWEDTAIDDYASELETLLSTTYATLKAAGSSPSGGEYKLTHTIWPGVHSPETVAAVVDDVDGLNLMTYGDDLDTYAADYADAGVPYALMIAGVEAETGDLQDSPDSIAAKAQYVVDNDLAGIFVWRLDNDTRPDGEPPTFEVTDDVYAALNP